MNPANVYKMIECSHNVRYVKIREGIFVIHGTKVYCKMFYPYSLHIQIYFQHSHDRDGASL